MARAEARRTRRKALRPIIVSYACAIGGVSAAAGISESSAPLHDHTCSSRLRAFAWIIDPANPGVH